MNPANPPSCRVCGCTDADCRHCILITRRPCAWVEPDLCSACVPIAMLEAQIRETLIYGGPTPAEWRRRMSAVLDLICVTPIGHRAFVLNEKVQQRDDECQQRKEADEQCSN